MKRLIFIAALWSFLLVYAIVSSLTHARADDYLDFSIGMFSNGRPSPADVKMVEIGHRDFLGLGFFNQYEGGGWIQVQEGDGRRSSAYAADQLGLEVSDGLVIRIATGPALIGTTDTYLGGHFQFTDEVLLGVEDKSTGSIIGFKYKHFSSAGLEMPNQGRDFGGLEVTIPW